MHHLPAPTPNGQQSIHPWLHHRQFCPQNENHPLTPTSKVVSTPRPHNTPIIAALAQQKMVCS
jgi:hypothetical protein